MSAERNPLMGRPQHHEEVAEPTNHVAWIELFYDLVHVVCVFMLGNYLSHHLSVEGFLWFFAIAAMIWMAWGDTVFYTSLYVTHDAVHRLIMALQMCAVMLFAAAIPAMPGKGETWFALAYGANRALLAWMYWRAMRHNEASRGVAYEMFRMFAILAVVFVVSAFLPNPINYVVWGLAILGLQFGYLSPSHGTMRLAGFAPRLEHLAERFQLLTLIVIGEGFFKIVVGLADKGVYKVGAGVIVNTIFGGLALFAMAWVYFEFSGTSAVKGVNRRDMPLWWYGHMVMMISAVMIGVALTGEIYVGFWEPYPVKYAAIGCGGLAIFLTACWVISRQVIDGATYCTAGPGLRIFGVALACVTFALVPFVPALIGNLVWGAALMSQALVPVFQARARDGEASS